MNNVESPEPGGSLRTVPSNDPENGATKSDVNSTNDEFAERRLVRKLDRRILPILCLLYLFACKYVTEVSISAL